MRQAIPAPTIEAFVVTAAQMQAIEGRVFVAGMPIAALMEKVGLRIARRAQELYPRQRFPRVGILAGPGHNGGDALVVARELHFAGYQVQVCQPFERVKPLTADHARYAQSLGIPCVKLASILSDEMSCDWWVDGLFGFGLERDLTGKIAELITHLNQLGSSVLSIDLPSGLATDTGQVLGCALRARQTLCLGLWKLGLLQDQALEYVGEAELIDIDLPLADIQTVLAAPDQPYLRRLTAATVLPALPLKRSPTTHKYQQGHLLLIGGSQRYAGSVLLAGLGARATGAGMVSIAVPASLKSLLNSHLPEALVAACPETPCGAIAHLPPDLDLASFDAIACGPGLTPEAKSVVMEVLASDRPLLLDADGLNILAELGPIPALRDRQAATILTPHPGEFRRLYPDWAAQLSERVAVTRQAAVQTGAVILLKGARVVIANRAGEVWINPQSSPALARGGSGDVLTGLIGGLLIQGGGQAVELAAQAATWWHAQAGCYGAEQNTQMGVDALTLTQLLIPALRNRLGLV